MVAKRIEQDPELTDSPSGRSLALSVRIPSDIGDSLKFRAKATGQSINDVVVGVLAGPVSWFGVPKRDAFELDRDLEAFGWSKEDYLQHLMSLRALAVREQGPGFDKPGNDTEKRSRR